MKTLHTPAAIIRVPYIMAHNSAFNVDLNEIPVIGFDVPSWIGISRFAFDKPRYKWSGRVGYLTFPADWVINWEDVAEPDTAESTTGNQLRSLNAIRSLLSPAEYDDIRKTILARFPNG